MAEINVFKIIQIVLALLGLIFASSSKQFYWALVVFYVLAVVYLFMILICLIAGKYGATNTLQAIFETIIGVTILSSTIYVLSTTSGPDTLLILTMVTGFILPAMLFISVYERI